jgi:aminoglycoside phosphotransferase (APT) family kinase protein
MSTVPPGVEAEAVSRWLADNVSGATPPFRFELISGGRSNLTYRVTDAAGSTWALRRPPLGHVLATAHDMGREHRIISALWGSEVPVARAVGMCADESVNGAPFYVMDFVDGVIVRDIEIGRTLPEPVRRHSSEVLIDTLAALHRIDVDSVGLGTLGKREGYVGRQLRRWTTQLSQSVMADRAIFAEVHALLERHLPEQRETVIAHGDYRLENTVIHPDGELAAVLDWELCTLGDPLADLGHVLVYWPGPGPEDPVTPLSPTALPGYFTPDEVVVRYRQASGRDVSAIDYYVGFADWRLACISAGVFTRYTRGAMGTTEGVDLVQMERGVLLRVARALDRLR